MRDVSMAFPGFSMTFAVFHDYPSLESLEYGLPKFHDFPGPVVTLDKSTIRENATVTDNQRKLIYGIWQKCSLTARTKQPQQQHDLNHQLCEKRRRFCVVSRPSAAAPMSSSASAPPALGGPISPDSAYPAADLISTSAICNNHEHIMLLHCNMKYLPCPRATVGRGQQIRTQILVNNQNIRHNIRQCIRQNSSISQILNLALGIPILQVHSSVFQHIKYNQILSYSNHF